MQPPPQMPRGFQPGPRAHILQQPDQRQAAMQAQMGAAIGQMAQDLYSDVMARRDLEATNTEELHQLARQAMAAARAFFEGIGLIQPASGEQNQGTNGEQGGEQG